MDTYQIEKAILEITLGRTDWSKLMEEFPEEYFELEKEFQSESSDYTIEIPSDS